MRKIQLSLTLLLLLQIALQTKFHDQDGNEIDEQGNIIKYKSSMQPGHEEVQHIEFNGPGEEGNLLEQGQLKNSANDVMIDEEKKGLVRQGTSLDEDIGDQSLEGNERKIVKQGTSLLDESQIEDEPLDDPSRNFARKGTSLLEDDLEGTEQNQGTKQNQPHDQNDLKYHEVKRDEVDHVEDPQFQTHNIYGEKRDQYENKSQDELLKSLNKHQTQEEIDREKSLEKDKRNEHREDAPQNIDFEKLAREQAHKNAQEDKFLKAHNSHSKLEGVGLVEHQGKPQPPIDNSSKIARQVGEHSLGQNIVETHKGPQNVLQDPKEAKKNEEQPKALQTSEKPKEKTKEESEEQKKKRLEEEKKKKEEEEKKSKEPPKPRSILSIAIHVFLALSGAYVCLFGFRTFRLLMIFLGFYAAYYLLLFMLTEFDIYDSENRGHQIGVFFAAIVLGFFVSVVCYILDRINFFVFGLAAGCVMGLFYAQFFVDFGVTRDRLILLGVVLGFATLVTVSAFFILDQTIIWGSAVVGAIVCPINIGVLTGDFKSFEEREKLPFDAFSDFRNYLIICGVLLITGIGCQYYLRSRIISHMKDDNLNQIRGESFLN